MNNDKIKAAPPMQQLHDRAVNALAMHPEVADTVSGDMDAKRMVHELMVQQVELQMQNEELLRTQAELQESHARYVAFFDQAPVGYCTLNEQGLILESNLTMASLLGVERALLINREIARFVFKDDLEHVHASLDSLFANEERQEFELRMIRHNGALFWALLSATAVREADGSIVCRAVVSDISRHKFIEDEREQMTHLIQMATASRSLHECLSALTASLRDWSGCEAVGIRLRSGDDYPYYITSGFPAEFVLLENQLCAYGPDGRIVRDGVGDPLLDCMCGNILCGRFDPSQPFFTANGSFWSNNTTILLVSTSEADRQARTRNRCNSEGYESVALIPLRSGGQVFGLLQFNDHRPGRFSPDLIAHFERMAESLAMSLSQRQAEEALRESETRIREVIDLSEAGYFRIDREGHFQSVNSAWLRMYGYDAPQEVVGRHFSMVVVEGEQQAAQQFADMVRSGEAVPMSGTFSRRCKDGSTGYHTFSIRPVFQGDAIVGLEGFIIDRTEYQRIEIVKEFLANTGSGSNNEPFFNALARFLSHTLDMEFVCIDFLEGDGLTARTVAVWGDGHFEDNVSYALKDTPCGDVVGKQVCCFPANVCQLFPHDQVLQEMRAESYIGVTLFGHTGQPIGLIACVGRRPLVNRQLAEAVMTLVAVRAAGEMERLVAETALRDSEEKYRMLFREMLDGFALHEIICDAEGKPADYRFLAVNPAFERLTGIKAEDVTGRTVREILPDIEPFWIETYGKVALSGEPAFFEQYSVELDKYFEVKAFQPAPNHFSCIIEDITVRKRAEGDKAKLESQLHQSQKMESVGRLAGGVAHDFNNMLGVILGHACLVLMELDASHPHHLSLEEIRKAAERSSDLTRQLLAFARKQAVSPIELDLNSVVAGMLKMLQRLIGENIDLNWQPGDGLWPVKMDPSQIDQILANLCVNARDAIADVGRITIETGNCILDEDFCGLHADCCPGEYVRISVSDTGCGMDTTTLEQIFDPFFTTKGVGKGTGLGLSMVYGAVKQNNGYVSVHSAPGQGTTFTIYLPRHAEDSAQAPATPAHHTPTRGQETILVVEDEPTLLKMTSTMLLRQGYTVLQAGSPEKAILLAGEHVGEIQLLVTDVIMPDMNGRDLANTLLSHYPKMKRLFMSGYTADVIARHGVLEEGMHFIQKPFSVTDLAAKVREALDR